MANFFQKFTGGSDENAEHDPVDLSPLKPEKERKPIIAPRAQEPEEEEEEAVVEVASHSENESTGEDEGELTVDIYDRGDAIVIHSTVAGVKPEDIDVAITSDTVTVRGKRRCPEKVPEHDYYYKELFWGQFSRSVLLPEEIEEDMAEAVLKHGMLTIKLPKKRHGVIQKVKVKVV